MLKLRISDPENDQLAEKVKSLANDWGFVCDNSQTSGLTLELSPEYLSLRQLDEPKLGAVYVDFASDTLTYRRQHISIKKEAIAKAVGMKGNVYPHVLDATAGLGRDGFVLASLGCKVDMIERSPEVAALLQNGLERAASHPQLAQWLPQRMNLFHGRSMELLQNWELVKPDVVYLDPMFPHRKKSALVKKEMRLFQQLLGPDDDADLLLQPALKLAKKRVVVKRPEGAPHLNNEAPDITISGKKLRFDVYIMQPQDV